MLQASASWWSFSLQANPEVSDFICSHPARGDITWFDKRWIHEGSPLASQQTENSSQLTWRMLPTRTLHLALGKTDSLPCCYSSSISFKQHACLSVILTITTSSHQMDTFSGDRFNSFNIRLNWLLASESLIKAWDISWQAAYWWRADH